MKKVIIPITVILFLIGLLVITSKKGNSFSYNDINVNYPVKVHVSGCDACSGLTYCINGGSPITVNSCQFVIDLPKGEHSICIHCPNNKWGYFTFTVTGSPFIQDVYFTVQPLSGNDCECSNSK